MQNLLEKAQKARVVTLETCKELNWQFPTEKVWVQKFDGTFEVMTLKELAYETQNIDEYDGFGYSVFICPAPSFEEIWEKLPKEINGVGFKCILNGWNPFENSLCYVSYNLNKIEALYGTSDANLSEAAALLYLQLKKDNQL